MQRIKYSHADNEAKKFEKKVDWDKLNSLVQAERKRRENPWKAVEEILGEAKE